MTAIALVYNPDSGSAEEADVAGILGASSESLLEIPITEIGDPPALDGIDRIVAAGGDGSIAPVASLAAERGIPLGVVPAGTANDFAARMQLPADPEEAAKLAALGTTRRSVDLALLGTRPFVNVVSFGLSPAAAEAAEGLKESLGALAYTVGALRAATSEEPMGCRVTVDDRTLHEGPAWQVMVGCTGAFGGGAELDADADDGRLDAVVIEAGSRARLAAHALAMRAGELERREGVRSRRGTRVAVELEEPGAVNLDGELIEPGEADGDGSRHELEIEHAAFELVIP